MMKKIVALIFVCLPILISAQNQNPSNLKFKKIETRNFEIIYESSIENTAKEIATKLERQYPLNSKRLKTMPPKISMVVYNQSVTSNAYANISPRKMGWYITPMQSSALGITNWFSTLSIHEYSHVIQYDKFKTNLTKIGAIFFGDYGHSALMYAVPQWFYEGDAVYSETILTNNGRGRIASFGMMERCILMTEQKFSYNKAYLRSYKHYYPNHYYLGYNMVTHVYRNYEEDTWSNIISRSTIFSYWPFSFSRSMKRKTGYNVVGTYKNTMSELKKLYYEQTIGQIYTDAKKINPEAKIWKNYSDYGFCAADTIVAIKYGLNDANQLVYLTLSGQEESIKQVDAEFISVNKHKVIWASEVPDLRWGEQSFSNIAMLDLNSNKISYLTTETKFFAPEFSHDGQKIAVVEFNTKLECSLIILDAKNGAELKRIVSPNNDFIRIPKWSEDDKKITYCALAENGQAITILDLETEEITNLIPYSWENFSNPVFWNNYIIYNSDYSGVSNIYAINTDTNQRYQITSRPYGAYNPKISLDNKNLIFKDYDAKGFDLSIIPLDPTTWKKIEDVEIRKVEYFATDENRYKMKNIYDPEDPETKDSELKNYNISNYKEINNIINIHSWGIMGGETTQDIAFNIFSNNMLNTLILNAGINFHPIISSYFGFFNASYQKYFAAINLSVQSGKHAHYYDKNLVTQIDSIDTWKQDNISAGISVPLNFSRGVYSRYFNIKTNFGYTAVKDRDMRFVNFNLPETEINDGSFIDFNYAMSFNNIKSISSRAVGTRMGQNFEVSFSHTPIKQTFNAKQLYLASTLYFPGLLKNHNIKINIAYENQIQLSAENIYETYYYVSKIGTIRSYGLGTYANSFKTTIDYKMPLCYPDFSIGALLHIKRIKMLGFYDLFIVNDFNKTADFSSCGGQLLFDVCFLRLPIEIELGIEAAYNLYDSKIYYAPVVFGISF